MSLHIVGQGLSHEHPKMIIYIIVYWSLTFIDFKIQALRTKQGMRSICIHTTLDFTQLVLNQWEIKPQLTTQNVVVLFLYRCNDRLNYIPRSFSKTTKTKHLIPTIPLKSMLQMYKVSHHWVLGHNVVPNLDAYRIVQRLCVFTMCSCYIGVLMANRLYMALKIKIEWETTFSLNSHLTQYQ